MFRFQKRPRRAPMVYAFVVAVALFWVARHVTGIGHEALDRASDYSENGEVAAVQAFTGDALIAFRIAETFSILVVITLIIGAMSTFVRVEGSEPVAEPKRQKSGNSEPWTRHDKLLVAGIIAALAVGIGQVIAAYQNG